MRGSMSMAAKRVSCRRIKTHRSYTVEECAQTLGVCRATVRRWLKRGLPAIDDRKPALIPGGDLIDYLKNRQAPRHRCKSNECFSMKCREPGSPALNMADYLPLTSSTGNLRALCSVCGKIMHKAVSRKNLTALQANLELTVLQHDQHLADTVTARSKVYFHLKD